MLPSPITAAHARDLIATCHAQMDDAKRDGDRMIYDALVGRLDTLRRIERRALEREGVEATVVVQGKE